MLPCSAVMDCWLMVAPVRLLVTDTVATGTVPVNCTFNTLLDKVSDLVLPGEHRMHQRAVGVAICAAEKIARGEPGNGGDLTPNYLRLSQAERERMEKEKNK